MSEVLSDHEIIDSLADDLPVGLWVARAPGGEFDYANRMFAEIMGQGDRDDVAVGGDSEPDGILTRDGKRTVEMLARTLADVLRVSPARAP